MPTTFDSLGLPETMLKALARMDFTTPTPVQARTIPLVMKGRDVLASAQTGTGKTGAFCIPMIAKLMADDGAVGLVVTPTRELASQILDVVHKLTANNRAIRTALLIGGDSMGKQFAQLRDRPRLIVGTPGRINDHLRRNAHLLSHVRIVAIDEADRMLDMGFSVQLDEILTAVPQDRQTVMFSATFPDTIVKFSRNYLNDPERVALNPESRAAPEITHDVKRTDSDRKYTDLLAELEAREGSVIIFVKTQHGTDKLAKKLVGNGHAATPIHGGLRQNQRDRAVRDFRAMKTRILVATDVASRGLDIPHIEHVINYDLPQVAEDYIHRIGRTARAGAKGNAVAFVTPSDLQMWNAINRIMNPGAKPERGGREKAPFKKKGFKKKDFGNKDFGPQKGFKKDGYKKKGGFKEGRPGNDRRRTERTDHKGEDRKGGDKPFVKYYTGDDTRRGDKPAFGKKPFPNKAAGHRNDKSRDDKGRDDKGRPGREDRPRYNKDFSRGERPSAGRSSAGRPSADRSSADRPKRDRNHRFDGSPKPKAARPGPSGSGREDRFKREQKPESRQDGAERKGRDEDRSQKRKPKQAPGKPFKFKAHSRKPSRTAR